MSTEIDASIFVHKGSTVVTVLNKQDTTRIVYYSLVKHEMHEEIVVSIVQTCKVLHKRALAWNSASHVRFTEANLKLSKYLRGPLQV